MCAKSRKSGDEASHKGSASPIAHIVRSYTHPATSQRRGSKPLKASLNSA